MSRAFNLLVLVHCVVALPSGCNVRNYLYFTAYGCVALLLCCNMWLFWVEANSLEANSKFFRKLARQVASWRAKSLELARQVWTWHAPTVRLADAKSGCRAREVRLSRAPSVLGHLAHANLTVLARQVRTWRANSGLLARQLATWRANWGIRASQNPGSQVWDVFTV